MKTGIIPVPKVGEIGGHAMVIDSGKDNEEPRCKALSFVTGVLLSALPVTSKSVIHGAPALA
jgi:hypothetical protein